MGGLASCPADCWCYTQHQKSIIAWRMRGRFKLPLSIVLASRLRRHPSGDGLDNHATPIPRTYLNPLIRIRGTC